MKPADQLLNSAIIDLDAIAYNIEQIKNYVGPNVELYAVVKANGYGHGAFHVSKTALQHGATRLAVNRVIEGVELRKKGITAPILILGYSLASDADTIVSHDLTASVQNIETIRALSQAAARQGKNACLHLKIDSGMSRYGIPAQEVVELLSQTAHLSNIDIEGIFTHFSSASGSNENDRAFTRQQFSTFLEVIETARKAGFEFRMRHAANSAATLDLPETHLDGVRAGIAIYGLNPFDDKEPPFPLKPALTLKSHVARTRILPENSSISYGRTFTTDHPTPVALIPIGYGDGYHRILSNRAKVLIHGQPAPILGRVCMDQFVVDITGIENVVQDDEVILIGKQQERTIHAEELARLAETINYEITTGILPRIPRVYLEKGKMVGLTNLVEAD